MIPSTGWLPTVNNTNQPTERAPLPEPNLLVYGDGAQPTDDVPYEPSQEVLTFLERSLVMGVVTYKAEAGFIGNDYGFRFEYTQHDAYGVLLLDTVDPPDMTKDVEDPVDEGGTKEPCPSNDTIDSMELCCKIDTGWIFNGEVIFNGSRTFGAIP